ncbi:uncharacterized protein LOC6575366 [Drosophila mojavensis]|uniref:Solute carrier family 3 member 2 N-terminal domain-containing protein n=1 Tax=Drosophila mojavensis TaxID=7230 RepID=B4KBB1_DROMO|nr:uncharacterized protein LOC6575366 [Drosophila mojavensis]EDW16839.1 uncharacterized protein Dmoj_GI10757 [Drosophila mojavensis]
MSCNERTALLAAQQQQQHQQQQQQQEPHIILVPNKEAKDYEPVFTIADYSYGLSLEELLPFGWDPWWQKARRLCSVCLWLAFVLTLFSALALAYYHDTATICPAVRLPALPPTPAPPATLALATNGTLLLPG